MSNLTEIRQAYERLADLLDQEILARRGEAAILRRYRKWLDTAFYLLGWANFEYLTRKAAEASVAEGARSKGREKYAWTFLQEGLKTLTVRKRLELVFHGKHKVLETLQDQYTVRNEAAHNYKFLPPEAKNLPDLLRQWEDLVGRF